MASAGAETVPKCIPGFLEPEAWPATTRENSEKAAARAAALLSDSKATTLFLSKLGLTEIPGEFFADPAVSSKLRVLEVDDNLLSELPKQLGECFVVKTISCANNRLLTLPKSLGRCEWLQAIDCSHNRLEAFPSQIGGCPRLTVLLCSGNALEMTLESLLIDGDGISQTAILRHLKQVSRG